MNKFIVFNCGYNGLAIIRDLAKKGIKGYALDTYRSAGAKSRHATYIRVTDPKVSEQEFISQLITICKKETEKPVLFATNDEWVAAISKNKEILSQYAIPVVSDWDAVKTVLDKSVFYELGCQKTYNTPKTWEAHQILEISDEEYPLIIKPKWRRMTSGWGEQYDTKILDSIRFIPLSNKTEAQEKLNHFKTIQQHILLQSFIPGVADCKYSIGVYANIKNEVLAMFSGRKKRGYPAAYGDIVVGESADIPEELKTLIKRCTGEMGLEGILEFEFLYDELRNKYWLIEINPRSWSWVGITRHAGVSLPWLAYKDRTGKEIDLTQHRQKYSTGELKYVFANQDINNVLFKYKTDYPPWSMGFIAWMKDLRKKPVKKVVFADFFWDDWMPTLYGLKGGIKEFIRNSRRKKTNK